VPVPTPPAHGRSDFRSFIAFDAITFRRSVDGLEFEITIDRSRLARVIERRLRRNITATSYAFSGAITAVIIPDTA
jgi:hypothetical protein